MWQPRIVPQAYPWIGETQVKKKTQPPATILSARYGAPTGSIPVSLSLPINFDEAMDITAAWGPDPAFGVEKRLMIAIRHYDGREDSIFHRESCGRWDSPLYYHPEATLGVLLNGGLSNQIYEISSACIVASKTHRSLTFPFRILARKDCLEPISMRSKPTASVDAPFSRIFDAEYFIAHCGVRLCLLQEGDIPVQVITQARSDDGKVVEEQPQIDQRYIADGVGLAAPAISSASISHYCYAPYQHISLLFPLLSIIPATRTDYDIIVNAMLALRPAPRLLAVADDISSRFLTDVDLLVVHCRIEDDWKAAMARHVATPEMIIGNIRKVKKSSSIYVIGNTANGAYWNELKSKAPEYKWLRKEDFDVKVLGFEEGAVIDRELACRARHFLGFATSTLSLVVGLARHHAKKPYSFYNVPVDDFATLNNPVFLYKDGKPLQDQYTT